MGNKYLLIGPGLHLGVEFREGSIIPNRSTFFFHDRTGVPTPVQCVYNTGETSEAHGGLRPTIGSQPRWIFALG
jgi:hypothetical protein